MSEVNKERVKELVDALRSGKYRQARHRLRKSNRGGKPKMCCLGVACHISGLGKWTGPMGDLRYTVDTDYGQESSAINLPWSVADWYGFDSQDPLVKFDGYSVHLGGLNDDGRTFKTIADAIERTFLEGR